MEKNVINEDKASILDRVIVKTFKRRVPAIDLSQFNIKGVKISEDIDREPLDYESLKKEGIVLSPLISPEAARMHITDDYFLKATSEESSKEPFLNDIMKTPVALEEVVKLLFYPIWLFRGVYDGKNSQILLDGNSLRIIYALLPGKPGRIINRSVFRIVGTILLLTTLFSPSGLSSLQHVQSFNVLIVILLMLIFLYFINNLRGEGLKPSFIDDKLLPFFIDDYLKAKRDFLIEIVE